MNVFLINFTVSFVSSQLTDGLGMFGLKLTIRIGTFGPLVTILCVDLGLCVPRNPLIKSKLLKEHPIFLVPGQGQIEYRSGIEN